MLNREIGFVRNTSNGFVLSDENANLLATVEKSNSRLSNIATTLSTALDSSTTPLTTSSSQILTTVRFPQKKRLLKNRTPRMKLQKSLNADIKTTKIVSKLFTLPFPFNLSAPIPLPPSDWRDFL